MNDLKLKDIASTIHEQISPEDTLKYALEIMKKNQVSSVVIIEDKKPVGIFTERDAIKSIALSIPLETKLKDLMTKNPFVVDELTRLHDAYVILESKRIRHLIVVNNKGEFTGVVTEGDFIRNLGLGDVEDKNVVEDIMIPSPVTVSSDTLIIDVAKIMNKNKSDYAIVIQDNSPISIIKERDIVHYFINDKDIFNNVIGELSYKQMYFVKRNVALKEAASLMEKHGVHQLIVTDSNEKIIGVLDRHSVLKAIHRAYIDFLIKVIDDKSVSIEELEKIQDNLSSQTTFLKNVINTVPDLIWLKDKNGVYLACNKKFEKFMGKTENEIVGKTDFELVDKEQAEFFRKNDISAMDGSSVKINEEFLVFKDGSYKGYFETLKTAMKDDNGKVIGVLGVARDITQKKKQLQAFNNAQAIAHIGSWNLDLKSSELEWSDECYRIFGKKIGSKVNLETFFASIYKDDIDKVKSTWEKALKTSDFDIIHRITVGKKIKWVRAKAKLETDSKGKIIYATGTVQDITLYKEYEEKLVCMASIDSLTGLANRTLLHTVLEKVIQLSVRNGKKCALLLFDLDHFKDINDSFGHNVGDEILKEIAKRLKKRLRQSDIIARIGQASEESQKCVDDEDVIARLGGDEFAVVLSSINNSQEAAKLAKEIMEIIAQPYELSTKAIVHVSASVGIAIAPDHSIDPTEILQFADSALYKAKNDGRVTFAFYSDILTLKAKERLEGESRLREAIKNGELQMYYQPQVHIKSGRIVGMESLVRWIDPKRGLIPPDEFIPLAEQSGLIIPLGEWVLEESCKQAKRWLDKGYRLHLSVNVSANQVHYYDISKLVDEVLLKTGFDADKLILELTESTMMKRKEEIVKTLYSIRSKGIKIAIDDFGTGYSSYNYLKRFPIDILKIDKTFIDDIPYEKDNIAIVKAIIAMGQAMGYEILAEGVEHIEQVEFLKEEGCEFYQGYYKSKPLPAEEFEKLLEEN